MGGKRTLAWAVGTLLRWLTMKRQGAPERAMQPKIDLVADRAGGHQDQCYEQNSNCLVQHSLTHPVLLLLRACQRTSSRRHCDDATDQDVSRRRHRDEKQDDE